MWPCSELLWFYLSYKYHLVHSNIVVNWLISSLYFHQTAIYCPSIMYRSQVSVISNCSWIFSAAVEIRNSIAFYVIQSSNFTHEHVLVTLSLYPQDLTIFRAPSGHVNMFGCFLNCWHVQMVALLELVHHYWCFYIEVSHRSIKKNWKGLFFFLQKLL